MQRTHRYGLAWLGLECQGDKSMSNRLSNEPELSGHGYARFPDYVTAAFYGFSLSIIIKPVCHLSAVQVVYLLFLLCFLACDGSIKFEIRKAVSSRLGVHRLLLLMAETGGLLCFAAWGAFKVAGCRPASPPCQDVDTKYDVLGWYFLFCALFNIVYLARAVQTDASTRTVVRVVRRLWLYLYYSLFADAAQVPDTIMSRSLWVAHLNKRVDDRLAWMRASKDGIAAGRHAKSAIWIRTTHHLICQLLLCHFVWFNAMLAVSLFWRDKMRTSSWGSDIRTFFSLDWMPTWIPSVGFPVSGLIVCIVFYRLTSGLELSFNLDNPSPTSSTPPVVPVHAILSLEGILQLLGNLSLVAGLALAVIMPMSNAPLVAFGLGVQSFVMLVAVWSESIAATPDHSA